MMFADVATPRVSFNARSTQHQTPSPPAHVQFDEVLYNQGDAFSGHTGNFTAPVAGTYVFVFHIRTDSTSGAESVIKANGVEICRAIIQDGNSYEHGSCPAVVHLNTGDRVWVEPYGGRGYYQSHTSSFIGFLISDDPQ